jgi:NAD(P)-dependent dehydrogenase (short-subunit alcohol dehydrogenase family)
MQRDSAHDFGRTVRLTGVRSPTEGDDMSDVTNLGAYLVTGGAGGIGTAVCERLVDAGMTVVVADANEQSAKDVASRLDCDYVAVDLRNRASVNDAVSNVVRDHSSISGVVNCAGVTRLMDFFEITTEDWHWMMDINALGTMHVMQAVGSRMRDAGTGGSIVNIASIAGKGYRQTSNAAYAATKGAVLALTKVAAIQLAPYNIRVNAVCPGPTNSPLLSVHNTPEAQGRISAMVEHVPLRKFSEPSDIAAAVQYLLTANTVTGQSMNVDGGLVLD